MAAPLPHGCPLSSLHSPHHRNMKTECSYHKEDDPLLRSSIHALNDAMEVASLLLPLLSMVWRPWRAPPDDPRCRGKAAALWDRVRSSIAALMSLMSSLLPSTACLAIGAMKTSFSVVDVSAIAAVQNSRVTDLGSIVCAEDALRINVCEQQQEYICGRQV
ncbi:hypothetical protein U9M48_012900 [Paspalum notatum var. saurae]|uniref:Uncharacterized protein n=1 Tax=Paspalum notatum var. saurae TaxID=547442 RepID=A0AAQ3SYH9_PASNO